MTAPILAGAGVTGRHLSGVVTAAAAPSGTFVRRERGGLTPAGRMMASLVAAAVERGVAGGTGRGGERACFTFEG